MSTDTPTSPAGRQGVVPAIITDPYADGSSQPFWDAAKENRLVAPKCTNCGRVRIPPAPFCAGCQTREVEWTELPGTGTVYSFTIVRHALGPELTASIPYAGGIVELDGTQGAGARMVVNIIDCDVETLKIGDRVEVVFEHINDQMSIPRFRPMTA
jgi:uncharacterized protein